MGRRMVWASVLLCGASFCVSMAAQDAGSSHEVHVDGTITFRYTDAAAKLVSVRLDTVEKSLAMQRDAQGVWTVTTPVMPADIYGYSFVADHVALPDPRNPHERPNFLWGTTEVTVPGKTPEAWEPAAIPHGRVDRHMFTTHVAKNMPQGQDAFYVYTPPGYDARRKGGYPVLYLLHGFSDDERGWTEVGRADLIMDRLIADGKAVPMIVVMPLGYGDLQFVLGDDAQAHETDARVYANVQLFEETLLREMMPQVEREYNAAKGRDQRAIAGLSMGGLESLVIGLHHPEMFAWVGGFSAGLRARAFDEHFGANVAHDRALKLVWLACGTDDAGHIADDRAFAAWAKEKKLPVTWVETEGAHQWPVWRRNLIAFAPLLFRK